jgi:hypothetical protein
MRGMGVIDIDALVGAASRDADGAPRLSLQADRRDPLRSIARLRFR